MNEKKILYVEDDLSLIEGLKYTLEKNGFQVDNARTVKAAYQFFQGGRYDLLLLDVTLPDGTVKTKQQESGEGEPFKLCLYFTIVGHYRFSFFLFFVSIISLNTFF